MIFARWFDKSPVRDIPRERRVETLEMVFPEGFDDFHTLLESASWGSRIAGGWVEMYMRDPASREKIEKRFSLWYFTLLRRF